MGLLPNWSTTTNTSSIGGYTIPTNTNTWLLGSGSSMATPFSIGNYTAPSTTTSTPTTSTSTPTTTTNTNTATTSPVTSTGTTSTTSGGGSTSTGTASPTSTSSPQLTASQLYTTYAGRQGEQAGIDYWQGLLDDPNVSYDTVLASFKQAASDPTNIQIATAAGYYDPNFATGSELASGATAVNGVSTSSNLNGGNSMPIGNVQNINVYEPEVTTAQSTGYDPAFYTNVPNIDPSLWGATLGNSTNYNAAQQGNANTYTGQTIGSQGYDSQNYNAVTGQADPQGMYNANLVNNTATVQDRLNGLLSQGSDYMQLARTQALQNMNSRGLSNSSMAIGAGQAAAIAAGMPIASQDASMLNATSYANQNALNNAAAFNANVYNQYGLANLGYLNQAAQFNAGANNAANQFNANAMNNALMANQNSLNQSNQFNAAAQNAIDANNIAAQNQALAANAAAANQYGLANQSALNNAASENAAAMNAASTWNATAQNQANLANTSALNQSRQYAAQAANDFAMANMNAINQAARDFAAASNSAATQDVQNQLSVLLANAQNDLSRYGTDVQRQTALDGIASSLIQAGVEANVFATVDGGANWLRMIGDVYPDMGLSISDSMASNLAGSTT